MGYGFMPPHKASFVLLYTITCTDIHKIELTCRLSICQVGLLFVQQFHHIYFEFSGLHFSQLTRQNVNKIEGLHLIGVLSQIILNFEKSKLLFNLFV